MSRSCESCGGPIAPQVGPGRPRKKCETCKPSKAGSRTPAERAVVKKLAVVKPTVAPVERLDGMGYVESSFHSRLERADRLDTPAGASAMYAARLLDEGGHSAPGAAALLKQALACLEEAVKDAPVENDFVDDLKELRRARRGS